MPGEPTAVVTRRPTDFTLGGSLKGEGALEHAIAAAQSWLLRNPGVPADVSAASSYAAAVASAYAAAGGNYQLAYQVAYAAFQAASARLNADHAAGRTPRENPAFPAFSAADPYGYLVIAGGTAQEADEAIDVALPAVQGGQAGGAGPGPGQLGAPAPLGQPQPLPPLRNQADQVSGNPGQATLADACASLPLPARQGAGVPVPLSRQIERVR
jgi:hypothetical protein